MKPLYWIARILLCGWAIGIGFRFVFEYTRNSTYKLILFDTLFDWSGLMILGVINTLILTREYYEHRQEKIH